MLKGAVFDMDGLMFDSERLVYEIWQSIMDELGYEYNVEIFKNTIGLRAESTKEYYEFLYGNDFNFWELKARSRQMFLTRIENEGVPVKKGLFELLEYLASEDFKISLATSTSSKTATKLLKTAGVYKYFDALVCGDDVKNGKPHPEVFLTAAKRIGIPPEHCVAFEDSINGIKAAYNANMKTVMVPDFLQPEKDIIPMISFLCRDLSQAVDYLSNH